jgi:hypothetical protein
MSGVESPQEALVVAEVAASEERYDRAEEAILEALSRVRQLKHEEVAP